MLLLSINQFLIIQGGIFMKKTLSLILILSMFLCSNLSVFAMETTSTTSSTCNIYNDVESSGARIVHNYKKTITKVYQSRSSIPDSINYSEYNNSLKGTFSGRLYLKSIKKTASGWQATFSGTLNWKNLKFHYFKWIIKNQEKTSFFDIFSFIYNNIVLPQTGSL